jgi:hypothetical protein
MTAAPEKVTDKELRKSFSKHRDRMKREAINPKSDYDRWQMRIIVVLRRHRDIWIQRAYLGRTPSALG